MLVAGLLGGLVPTGIELSGGAASLTEAATTQTVPATAPQVNHSLSFLPPFRGFSFHATSSSGTTCRGNLTSLAPFGFNSTTGVFQGSERAHAQGNNSFCSRGSYVDASYGWALTFSSHNFSVPSGGLFLVRVNLWLSLSYSVTSQFYGSFSSIEAGAAVGGGFENCIVTDQNGPSLETDYSFASLFWNASGSNGTSAGGIHSRESLALPVPLTKGDRYQLSCELYLEVYASSYSKYGHADGALSLGSGPLPTQLESIEVNRV